MHHIVFNVLFPNMIFSCKLYCVDALYGCYQPKTSIKPFFKCLEMRQTSFEVFAPGPNKQSPELRKTERYIVYINSPSILPCHSVIRMTVNLYDNFASIEVMYCKFVLHYISTCRVVIFVFFFISTANVIFYMSQTN